jgi:hypothetical protein
MNGTVNGVGPVKIHVFFTDPVSKAKLPVSAPCRNVSPDLYSIRGEIESGNNGQVLDIAGKSNCVNGYITICGPKSIVVAGQRIDVPIRLVLFPKSENRIRARWVTLETYIGGKLTNYQYMEYEFEIA